MRYISIVFAMFALAVIVVLSTSACDKKEKPREASVSLTMIGGDREMELIKELYNLPMDSYLTIIPIVYPEERPCLLELGFIYSIGEENKEWGCLVELTEKFVFSNCIGGAMKYFDVEPTRSKWTGQEFEEIEVALLESFTLFWIDSTTREAVDAAYEKYKSVLTYQNQKMGLEVGLELEDFDTMVWEKVLEETGKVHDAERAEVYSLSWKILGNKLGRPIPKPERFFEPQQPDPQPPP